MAFDCSPYSASDSISNLPSMLLNEMIGKTTLMAPAETPRVLVLASVTGVGAFVAADGVATPKTTVLPRTTTAPPARRSLRRASDPPQRRIAISPLRRSNRTPRQRLSPVVRD